MLTMEDIKAIKELIEVSQKPILMETPWGNVAIVLSKKGANYWNERGFTTITLKQLRNLVLDKKGNPKEDQKSIIKTFMDAITKFDGKCVEAR